ncbi:MAG: BrnT family toxin [Acidobacteria bacterium]|nr:BrnT family toxin [Acidobacteriota bacterium]
MSTFAQSKDDINIRSHDGIDFIDASIAILDEYALEEFDQAHSNATEDRFTCIGECHQRILFVVYSIREDDSGEEVCRITPAIGGLHVPPAKPADSGSRGQDQDHDVYRR